MLRNKLTTAVEFGAYFGELAATLDALRPVSITRCGRWHPGGVNDWDLADWAVATAGELGEACNVVKKLNRDAAGIVGNTVDRMILCQQLGEELADTVIYLDLFCTRANLPALGDEMRMNSNWIVNCAAGEQTLPVSRIATGAFFSTSRVLELAGQPFRAITALGALAIKFDINLSAEIVKKFDAVSIKHGFPDRLEVDPFAGVQIHSGD